MINFIFDEAKKKGWEGSDREVATVALKNYKIGDQAATAPADL